MTRTKKIVYWVATVWLALGMVSSAIVQLLDVKDEVEMMTHLGYPLFFPKILAIWKILGVITVLAPGFPRLKEWAYAGFFFVMSGAAISHIVVGDGFGDIFPSLLLLTLTMVSWYLRPESRTLGSVAEART
jgi:uncharacterized membrane protein YphA (DoxX/SURF4 family)